MHDQHTHGNDTPARPYVADVSHAADKVSAVLALVFGIFLVFGVGFADSQALHAAAHDARHSFAFPCH